MVTITKEFLIEDYQDRPSCDFDHDNISKKIKSINGHVTFKIKNIKANGYVAAHTKVTLYYPIVAGIVNFNALENFFDKVDKSLNPPLTFEQWKNDIEGRW